MIDLHMHLNGSLPAGIVIKLAKKHGVELPTYDEEELKKKIQLQNVFLHLINNLL